MIANRPILALLFAAVATAAAIGCGGCAHKSDDTLVRERLKQFDRAWTEDDAAGVRMAMASQTPEERELADAFAELAASKKQLANAEQKALDRIEKTIPWPLRTIAGPSALGLKPGMLTLSRWDALAKEAASPQQVTILEDGHAEVTTMSRQVNFNLRKQKGRWVIDPQTFGTRGAAAAAAAVRREAGGNAQIVAALNSPSTDQLMQILPREAARRAADMVIDNPGDDAVTAGLIERILAAPSAAPGAAHE